MKIIDTKAAIQNRQRLRPHSIWSFVDDATRGQGFEAVSPGNGGARAFDADLHLRLQPKFRFGRDLKIFASGSCFAREVELAFHQRGYKVLSWNPSLDISNDMFHRYNTFSIINDFEFAFQRPYGPEYINRVGEGKFVDFSGYGTFTTADEVMALRQRIIECHRRVVEADVVVVTLGLVEAWYDRQNASYCNITPYALFASQPDRFELRITNYQENLEAVQRFIEFLTRLHPTVKIVLTVSPVPFSDTFSGQDVIVANTYSKSVLRCVAQDLTELYDHVDYFPSYEIVMMSAPAQSWLDDFRHVRRERVAFIVSEFERSYVEAAPAAAGTVG